MREREQDDVYSPLDGIVKYALTTESSYGNRVYIDYGNNILMFAHLAEFYVSDKETVKAGQLIGKIGDTGYSPSKHLHISAFTKRAKALNARNTVNPTYVLKLAKYWPTNTIVSNGYGSKFFNKVLIEKGIYSHEGIDFSYIHTIDGWETRHIDPLDQDLRLKKDYPDEY